MLNRRTILCGLFVLVSVTSTGCCGRLRNAVHRWRHCQACCFPSFDAPAPVFDAPVYGGPIVAGPDPSCATCFTPPVAAAPVGAIPVSAPAPVFGAPLPAPTPLGPPSVYQTTEPPMNGAGSGK